MEEYLEKTGMAFSTFGIVAAGDPSLVLALHRGRVCRLDLVDRVLEFMGREPMGPGFRREVEAYLEVTRTKPYLFGWMAMRNPTFLSELRRGVDMNLETVGTVRRWMESRGRERQSPKCKCASVVILPVFYPYQCGTKNTINLNGYEFTLVGWKFFLSEIDTIATPLWFPKT